MQRAFNVSYIYLYLLYWKLKFQNKTIQAHVPKNLHRVKAQENE